LNEVIIRIFQTKPEIGFDADSIQLLTLHRHEVRTHTAAFQRANTTFYECNVLNS
jgi:hypothetical protein